ncbi:hypothetical protein GIV49_04295 [Pseudomonas syringae]|nr:hypothetical protein [Pseudomonas syringae]
MVSVKDLEASIEHYLETYNQNPRPFRWHKKAEDILCLICSCSTSAGAMIFFGGTSEIPLLGS